MSKTLRAHRLTRLLCSATLAAAPFIAQAATPPGITDPVGDFLPTFGGSASETDLDVVSATVTYNASTDIFTLSATMDGAVGSTASGFYVWGVNTGSGTAGFASEGITGVRFNQVVILNANLTGSIGGGPALPTGSVTVSGDTITGIVSGALLPGTGFQNTDYTWNLWPRDGAFAGFAAISDFAPDNANFTTTPVPEPETYALMLAGLGVVALLAKKRARGVAAQG